MSDSRRRSRRAGELLAASGILTLVVLAGCGAGSGDGPSIATIYVSAPTTGPAAADGQDMADGARLAAADGAGEIGGTKIEVEYLDDATGTASFDQVKTAANARRASEDSTAIAYIGELDSGATRTSLPVTNQAGILQVSPGSGASDLVRAEPFDDDVPTEFQTTGKRTFARLVPSDEQQGADAARLLRKAPGSGAVIVDDGSSFGQELSDGFESVMANAVVAPRGTDEKPDTPALEGCTKARRAVSLFGAARDLGLKGSSPVFGVGGGRPVAKPRIFLAAEPGCAQRLLREARDTGVDFTVIATDAMRSPAGIAALGAFDYAELTSATKSVSELPPEGGKVLARFRDRFDRRPGPYAAYGYEAMASVLAAIDRSGDATDRDSVAAAYLDGTERDSVLGSYAISDLGETSLGLGKPLVVRGRAIR